MARTSVANRLLRRAATSTAARSRFTALLGTIVVFSAGVALLRWTSYTTLLAAHQPRVDATRFLQLVFVSALGFWTSVTLFAVATSSARGSADLFFKTTVHEKRLITVWRRSLFVVRPVTIVPTVFALMLITTAATESPRAFVLSIATIAGAVLPACGIVMLAARTARNARHLGNSAVMPVTMVLFALTAPEFRIADGVVVPIVAGIALNPSGSFWVVFLPLVIPLFGYVETVLATVVRHRKRSPARAPRPLFSLYRSAFGVGYWSAAVVLIAAAQLATAKPWLITLAAAASGAVVTLVVLFNRISNNVQLIGADHIAVALQRRIGAIAALSCAMHIAISVTVWRLVAQR